MATVITQSEMNAIIANRGAANRAKARLFIEPKTAVLGGLTIGLWQGLVKGFTGYESDEDGLVVVPDPKPVKRAPRAKPVKRAPRAKK